MQPDAIQRASETPPAGSLRTGRLLCWLLLLVLLLASGWGVQLSHANIEQRRADVFAAETTVLQLRMKERLLPYRSLSRNLIGFFLASEAVEQREWSVYLLALQLDRHQLFLHHVWFAYAGDDAMAAHYRRQHSEPDQPPTPPPDSDGSGRWLPLLYVHPVTAGAEGVDIYPGNRAAIERADDRRETTLSTSIRLLPESPATLAFITPFFRQHELAGSPQPAMEGVLGVNLSIESLLETLLTDAPQGLVFEMYRGHEADTAALLFSNAASGEPADQRAQFSRIEKIQIDGQPLTLRFLAPADWEVPGIDRLLPYLRGLGGLLISLLAFGIAWTLESTRERAEAIAGRMTVELRLANRALAEMASTDALTGLLNRRAFFTQLHDELTRVQRYRQHCTVILLDIDHFKTINDGHGHPAGDAVLSAVGELLRRELRKTDFAARIGGEEFALLLPHTGLAQGLRVAEQLREKFAAQRFSEAGAVFGCSASFGVVSTAEADSESAEGLIRLADRALYEAKEAGRNRVVAASEPAALPDSPVA
jgi:diguanylate cyclase (GGDEF)-like protein